MDNAPVLWQALLQLAAVFGVLMAVGAGIWKLSALASRVGSHGYRLDNHDAELRALRATNSSIDSRMTRMEGKQDAMLAMLDEIKVHGCYRAEDVHGKRDAR